MRLIDADKISYFWHQDCNGRFHEGVTMQSMIDAVPTVDAVEVVRCKDCRFYEQGVEYYHYDGIGAKDVCRLYKRQMQEDDFCSYGERRNDNDL